MSINLTDEIEVKTKKGKLGAAKQIFLEGDIQNVEKEIQDINSRHSALNTKHESLSKTVQGIAATGGASTATNVTYNNNTSGLNAENVQDAIDKLVTSLKSGFSYKGIAQPTTNPGVPDRNVFYIAGEGSYPNFNNQVVEVGQIAVLKWDGSWHKEVLEIGSGGNMILDWNTDVATTRKQVPAKKRKSGMQISYKPDGEDWVNEQYIGTSFTDSEWVKDNNWDKIPNSFNTILINLLNSYSSINPITWIKGKKVKSYAAVGSVSPMIIEEDRNFMYAIIDCKKGDTFYFVNAQGSVYYRTYVVLNSSNNVLFDGGATVVKDKDIVISQDDAAKIVINNTISDELVLYGRKNDIFFNKANNELDVIKNSIGFDILLTYEGLIDNYANVGSKPSLTVSNNEKYKYAIINCAEGDTFQLVGGYNNGYNKLFSFLDAEGNIISIQSNNTNIYSNYKIILRTPANTAQLICNLHKDGYITKTTDAEYNLSSDLKSIYECTELSESSVESGYINDNGLKGSDNLFNIKSYNLYTIFKGVGKVLVEIENDNAIDGYIDYAVTGLSWNESQVFIKGDSCKVGIYQKVIDINVNNAPIVLRLAYSKSCKVYLINDKINSDDIFGNESSQTPMGTGLDYETLSTEYDYSVIMSTGQSLSIGTINSGNIDFTAVDGCYMLGGVSGSELLPLKVNGKTDSEFPITVTLCNSFKKMLNKTIFKDVNIISLPVGIGGVPISEYEPENSAGKNLISKAFTKLKESVGDKKVNIIGIIWMQGENDSNTDTESYYNSLVNVKNWIQDKAIEVFGQKNKPLFFTYQTGAGYSNRQSIAQFNCAKNNEDTILLNPSHIMWGGTGGTHPNANGYRMYGEITAFQFKRIFLDGYKATAVYPKTIRVDKEFVYINCIVPVPPLRINTKTLFPSKTSIGNDFYGFTLYNKDNSSYIGIKSISIVGGCTIKLTAFGDLTGINLSVRFLNTGNGGRGIICDSQEAPTVSKYAANSSIAVDHEDATDIYGNSLVGKSYPTYNWLNQFELDVDNSTIPAVLDK